MCYPNGAADDYWVHEWAYSQSGIPAQIPISAGSDTKMLELVYAGTQVIDGQTWHKIQAYYNGSKLWYRLPDKQNVPPSLIGQMVDFFPVEEGFGPGDSSGYSAITQSEIQSNVAFPGQWDTGDVWATVEVQTTQGGPWQKSSGTASDRYDRSPKFYQKAYGNSYFFAVFTDRDGDGGQYDFSKATSFDGQIAQQTVYNSYEGAYQYHWIHRDPIVVGDDQAKELLRMTVPSGNYIEVGWVKGTVPGWGTVDKVLYVRTRTGGSEQWNIYTNKTFAIGQWRGFLLARTSETTYRVDWYNGSSWEFINYFALEAPGWVLASGVTRAGDDGRLNMAAGGQRDEFPKVLHGSGSGDIAVLFNAGWKLWDTTVPTYSLTRYAYTDQPNPYNVVPATWKYGYYNQYYKFALWTEPW